MLMTGLFCLLFVEGVAASAPLNRRH